MPTPESPAPQHTGVAGMLRQVAAAADAASKAIVRQLIPLVLRCLVSSDYRFKALGRANVPAQGGVLLLGNHLSWIDWALVHMACPRPVRSVVLTQVYERWYLRWLFRRLDAIPLQAGAPRAAFDAIVAALQRGDVVCLFPEGIPSRNGQLGHFRFDFTQITAQVNDDVALVPFFLRGLWGTLRLRTGDQPGRHRYEGLSRDIVLDFGMPLPRQTAAAQLTNTLRELAHASWEHHADALPTLGKQWIDACRQRGNPVILIDTLGTVLRAKQALTGTLILARRFRALSPEQNIGLLLPSSSGSVLANLALMLLGKTAVNLNFSSPMDALLSSVQQAGVRTVYTSRRFLERLESRGVRLDALHERVRFVLLEDLRQQTGTAERLLTLLACLMLPAAVLKALYARPHSNRDVAVILFSSGSEGDPKGITLSHRNLLANVKQISELLDFDNDDVVLANLPPFHAFGLTVTHFMPALERVPLVCHADPTDALGAAEAIARYRVTTMFGTSSFLRLYNRNAKVHPLMLRSLRLCIAGAEKLQEDVRREFKQKFDKDILEGYGATETAPVASVNLPDTLDPVDWHVQVGNKPGTVGRPLPGTAFLIVDPDTFAPLPTGEAGMILISGAQVMPGYLDDQARTNAALRLLDGKRWYVTGDKGFLDADGFLTLIDRYSRFAKIGGEMVGLGTVEAALKRAAGDENFDVVVVSVPDERKGERLVALCTLLIDPAALRERLLANGFGALALPAHYFLVDAIPRLGSGKTDYGTAARVAREKLASA